MIIIALFITAPNQKHTKCVSVGKWINTLLYLCDGILFSDIKEHTDASNFLNKSHRHYAE